MSTTFLSMGIFSKNGIRYGLISSFLKIVEIIIYKLKIQQFMNKIEHRVLYGDTDAGQVVYYANYLRWFESGRRELIRQLGIDFAKLENEGIIVPVIEVKCNYLLPARYDDIVIVKTSISEIKEKSIKFDYKILRKSDGKNLVEGTLSMFLLTRKR